MKKLIIISMIIESYAGSCIPLLWNDSLLSMSSIFFSTLGGIAGIFFGYKLYMRFE